MNSVNFIDFVFELESKRNLLIEGLLSLLVIFHQYVFIIGEFNIGISEVFQFFEDFCIFFLVYLLIVVYNLLPFLDLVT